MLHAADLRRWVDRFGVPEDQIKRDHLISHVLHRLPEIEPEVVFFGGTALCRTHLPDWRLSEDIDLLVDRPSRTAENLEDALPSYLRRDFPGLGLVWQPRSGSIVGHLRADGLAVRVQVVRQDDSYRRYPTDRVSVDLRYGDLPDVVELTCPTRDGAAAMKLTAWSERKAARDLCDLYGLASHRTLSGEALEIAAEASRPVQRRDFGDEHLPTQEEWLSALGHQMPDPPGREKALSVVRSTIADLSAWG